MSWWLRDFYDSMWVALLVLLVTLQDQCFCFPLELILWCTSGLLPTLSLLPEQCSDVKRGMVDGRNWTHQPRISLGIHWICNNRYIWNAPQIASWTLPFCRRAIRIYCFHCVYSHSSVSILFPSLLALAFNPHRRWPHASWEHSGNRAKKTTIPDLPLIHLCPALKFESLFWTN